MDVAWASLPEKIQINWKFQYICFDFKKMQHLANAHHERIQSACSLSQDKITHQLNDPFFWENLKAFSENNEVVSGIQAVWQSIPSPMHLTNRQLLNLLQQEILPLASLYRLMESQFKHQQTVLEQEDFWQPAWVGVAYQEALLKIRNNRARIEALKAAILRGLLARSQAQVKLNLPRQTDDLVLGVSIQINALNILKQPFNPNAQQIANIDDDNRLMIYDLLLQSGYSQEAIRPVLKSVLKRGQAAPMTNRQVQDSLDQFYLYANQLLKDLAMGSLSGSAGTASDSAPIIRGRRVQLGFQASFFGLFKNIIRSPSFFHFLLSFTAYFMLKEVLLGWAVTQGLFFGLALAPLWWLTYQQINRFGRFIRYSLQNEKKETVLHSLLVLESTRNFLVNRLSQPVLAVTHADIDLIEGQAEHHFQALNNCNIALLRSLPIYKRYFYQGLIELRVQELSRRLQDEARDLRTALARVAMHLAVSLEREITQFEHSVVQGRSVPLIPTNQISKLKAFVQKYGDAPAQAQFNRSANVTCKWVSKLERASQPYQGEAARTLFDQPWGGHFLRTDFLQGWQTLLDTFSEFPEERTACTLINNLLLGKQHVSLEALTSAISILSGRLGKIDLLDKIQNLIFVTMRPETIENAVLLSQKNKRVLKQWFDTHKSEIKSAEEAVAQLFTRARMTDEQRLLQLNNIPDLQLRSYYELLDGADIYALSVGKTKAQSKRKNKAREYFSHYKGDSALAYRFLKFLSPAERSATVVGVAQTRLDWILTKVEKSKEEKSLFSPIDLEMYHDRLLIGQSASFNFSAYLLNSRAFNRPWSKKMENFLNTCKECGLDSGRLLQCYREKHYQEKTVLPAYYLSQKMPSLATTELSASLGATQSFGTAEREVSHAKI